MAPGHVRPLVVPGHANLSLLFMYVEELRAMGLCIIGTGRFITDDNLQPAETAATVFTILSRNDVPEGSFTLDDELACIGEKVSRGEYRELELGELDGIAEELLMNAAEAVLAMSMRTLGKELTTTFDRELTASFDFDEPSDEVDKDTVH